jgi:hypothetical protein
MMLYKTFAVVLGFALSAPFLALGKQADQTISNGALRLKFSGADGALTSFVDTRRFEELLDPKANRQSLWELETVSVTNRIRIASGDSGIFRAEQLGNGTNGVRLTWEKFQSPDAPELKVQAIVKLDEGEAISRWTITLENTGKLAIDKVRFPIISGIRQRTNESLAVPVWLGQHAGDVGSMLRSGNATRMEWDYPGHLSLQCLAFYATNEPGFYASCDDTSALRKIFSFWSDGKQVNYEMVHLPESTAHSARRYETKYNSVIGTFSGDWITAAGIYRGWATNQPWAQQSRLKNKQVPKWVTDTGMWVWNRGRSENVLAPAVALQKELDLPVSVFWHWWHGCPYDIGFPEYLPPREGTEKFKEAVARAQKNDVRAIVYMNQRLWGMTTKSWAEEGAERFAVKRVDGQVHPEVYNVFTKQACATMCMGTSFWRNKYAGLAEEALNSLKVNGIYMDQACSSLSCYDKTHGHAIGGGAFWMDGFRQLSTDIRQRATSQEIALAGEGCGEAWLPYLDVMLALQVAKERYHNPNDGWKVIPFFSAVYHPYAVLYGNYSSLTAPPYDDLWPAEFAPKEPLQLLDQKFSQQFYLEQARSFVWGQQPTIANFMPSHLQERKEEIAYLLRLAKVRDRATKYLLHGTFLRPPMINVPEETLDLSRLSIYAGQKGGVTSFEGKHKTVLAGAWRASDGNVAIALANISREGRTIPLRFHPAMYQLPNSGKIFLITEKGRKKSGAWKQGELKTDIDLGSLQNCVIECVAD